MLLTLTTPTLPHSLLGNPEMPCSGNPSLPVRLSHRAQGMPPGLGLLSWLPQGSLDDAAYQSWVSQNHPGTDSLLGVRWGFLGAFQPRSSFPILILPLKQGQSVLP